VAQGEVKSIAERI